MGRNASPGSTDLPNSFLFHDPNQIMAKRSPYQDRIIRNYYQNQDQILLQRLGDLVTDLYLAEGESRVRLWKRAGETLAKLKIPNSQVQHVVQSDNPSLLAELLAQLLKK